MKRVIRFIATGTAVLALTLAAGAATTTADYHPNPSASECGQYHGAFGAFGKGNNFAGGADGQATGAANSAKGCQNGDPQGSRPAGAP